MNCKHARLSLALAVLAQGAIAKAANDVVGSLITFRQNAGWSWYSENRAIIDGNQLIFGSIPGVTNASGTGGDVNITSYNISTSAITDFKLSAALAQDDHNDAAILKLPNGKYLATYQKHGGDDLMRWRVGTTVGSIGAWNAEQTLDVNPANDGFGNTYTNTFYLSAESKIYNFSRSVGYDPNYSTGTFNATTGAVNFTYGDRYVIWNNTGGGRPYVKYASNNVDKIFLTMTDDHPRNFGNSIYAGYITGGNVFGSAGNLLGPLFTPGVTAIGPSNFTRVYAGDDNHRAWTHDIKLDASGNPYMAFSVRQIDGANTSYWYHYARWNGTSWNQYRIANAGNFLYAAENDYTGLVGLDPGDPDTLFMCTDVNPLTGVALPNSHHELFQGTTTDSGATWSWQQLTSNSASDNIRPIVTRDANNHRVVMWMRGTYTTYTNYDTAAVGIVQTIGANVSATWNVNANGNWPINSNWTPSAPNGFGSTVTFGSIINAPRTITIDALQTVSTLNFNNANKYTIAGSSELTLAAAANAAVNVTNGSHDITAPVLINQNTTVSVTNSGNTLKLTNLQATTKALTKAGAGTLEVNKLNANALSITGGKVVISSSTAPISTANDLNSLTLSAGTQLDLKNNAMVIHSADTTNVARNARWAQVLSAQNGFDANGQVKWDGAGITTSSGRASNLSLGVDVFCIGVISNHDLIALAGAGAQYGPGNPWLGSVTNIGIDDILIRQTYTGDTNLDGTITIDDYNNIDATYLGLTSNFGWVSGDFDFNGVITIDDYNAVDTGYLYQNGQLTQSMVSSRLAMFGASYVAHLEAVAAQFASVPEPSTMTLVLAGALGILTRRRRPSR